MKLQVWHIIYLFVVLTLMLLGIIALCILLGIELSRTP